MSKTEKEQILQVFKALPEETKQALAAGIALGQALPKQEDAQDAESKKPDLQ